MDRLPQTLWVVGLSYVIAILLAIPLGTISAVRQYSVFDQVGTVFSIIGYSVPTFFTGLLMIIIFSVRLGWFPSYYDTTLVVNDWSSFVEQVKQMIMPVTVLALFQTAAISRYTRSAVLDNLKQDYVRTAYSKGFREQHGRHPPRAAQQPDPGGDADCLGHSANLRWRHHHRTDLPGQRAG